MKIARKILVTLAATVVSLGLVSMTSAPAHADSSWGMRVIAKTNK